MHDVGANFGIIVTTIGYSDSIRRYAKNANIEIKVIPYDYFKNWEDFEFLLKNYVRLTTITKWIEEHSISPFFHI